MGNLRINLCFHGHQPAGNDPQVVQRAIRSCYRPMLEALETRPSFRCTLHLSGSLIRWMEDLDAELIDRVAEMNRKGQLELLGGGLHEPILAMLPEGDAMAQLEAMNTLMERHFGKAPEGAWIAERVWEPQLAAWLNRAGLSFSLLDDSTLLRGGLQLLRGEGYRMVDLAGESLAIFPIDSWLRHALPGRPVAELMQELNTWAREDEEPRLLCFADDWEKFGQWPGSAEGVWEQGWMSAFLDAVLGASNWLETCQLGDWKREQAPAGRVYPAASAYDELQTWSLDQDLARRVEVLREELPPEAAPLLRPGNWRNFLVRYPEANRLYRKILAVSHKLAEALDEDEREDALWTRARELLLEGQDHAGMWHGFFAGLYSPGLRQAQYARLLEAEDLLDRRAQGDEDWIAFDQLDYDGDGLEEILIENRLMNVLLAPAQGAQVICLEHRESLRSSGDVVARHREAYHPPDQAYDRRARGNFVDRFLAPNSTLEDLLKAQDRDEGDFAFGGFALESAGIDEEGDCDFQAEFFRMGRLRRSGKEMPLAMNKRIRIPADGAEVEMEIRLRNPGENPLDLLYCPEFNLALEADGSGTFEFDGMAGPGPEAASVGELSESSWMAVSLPKAGLRLRLSTRAPTRMWRHPIECNFRSDLGQENLVQGLTLGPCWEMTLPPKAERSLWLRLSLQRLAADDLVPLEEDSGADEDREES